MSFRAKDWENAARELVAHFESRTDLIPAPEERKIKNLDPDFDRSYADLVATMAIRDGNPDSTPEKLLKKGFEEFGRNDMLWVATGGEEGQRPKKTSVQYPYSKYYLMRSDWSPEALYMCLKNGRYSSHGHSDSLGFVMYACGNAIFVEPGVYIYGTPEAVRHNAARSHSTVSVDEKNLENGGGPNQFFAGESVDYINAVGPRYLGLPKSIYPVRRVVFLKPDYWVFSDVVRGEGKHQVDSRFHYANKNAVLDPDNQVALRAYETGGNLAVIPVDPKVISSQFENGDVAGSRDKLTPTQILKQSGAGLRNRSRPKTGSSGRFRVSRLTSFSWTTRWITSLSKNR